MERLFCAFSKTDFGTICPKELWGSFFDLWFLVPLTGLLVVSEAGGDIHRLGRNLLYLGVAYFLSAIIFRTPLPLQPLKVWAFLFLILHPTPMIASVSAILLGVLLFLSGRLGLVGYLSNILSDASIRGVKRAVGIYVYTVGAFSLLLWVLHNLSGIALPQVSDSILKMGIHSPGTFLEVLLLVLPQLPVTLINGVLATVREKQASQSLSDDARHRLTGNRTSCWLGLANILAGILGLLPFCHGSGGLWSYRRYNIRTIFPSLFSSSILFVLGFILVFQNISIPGPAFFGLFLAGFLFAEYLLTRKESLKTGFANTDPSTSITRDPLGLWILSGGMLSGLVALGGIPAVLVFLLGMNTVLTLSKTNQDWKKTARQGAVVHIAQETSIPVKNPESLSDSSLTTGETSLIIEKTDREVPPLSCPIFGNFHDLDSNLVFLKPLQLATIGEEGFLFSNQMISSSGSPVRGDPELIRSMGDLYRRARKSLDHRLISLLLLFFLSLFLLTITLPVQKFSETIAPVKKAFLLGPSRIRAP